MECADNAALQDRPKAFNRVGVNCTNNIFVFAVLDERVRKFASEFPISAHVVSDQQTHFVRNRFADEIARRGAVEMLHDAGDDVSLPADRADNSDLAGASTAATAAALVPMFVLVLPPDVGFTSTTPANLSGLCSLNPGRMRLHVDCAVS